MDVEQTKNIKEKSLEKASLLTVNMRELNGVSCTKVFILYMLDY